MPDDELDEAIRKTIAAFSDMPSKVSQNPLKALKTLKANDPPKEETRVISGTVMTLTEQKELLKLMHEEKELRADFEIQC